MDKMRAEGAGQKMAGKVKEAAEIDAELEASAEA